MWRLMPSVLWGDFGPNFGLGPILVCCCCCLFFLFVCLFGVVVVLKKSQVPSAKCQVPSAKCQVPSAKCQVLSAKCQVPSAKCYRRELPARQDRRIRLGPPRPNVLELEVVAWKPARERQRLTSSRENDGTRKAKAAPYQRATSTQPRRGGSPATQSLSTGSPWTAGRQPRPPPPTPGRPRRPPARRCRRLARRSPTEKTRGLQ